MLLQIQIKLIKNLTKIIIKHIIIYTTSQFFWHFYPFGCNSQGHNRIIFKNEVLYISKFPFFT